MILSKSNTENDVEKNVVHKCEVAQKLITEGRAEGRAEERILAIQKMIRRNYQRN